MPGSVHIGGTPRSELPVLGSRRLAILLELGLTERDLAFMGAKQRRMVEEVLSRKEDMSDTAPK